MKIKTTKLQEMLTKAMKGVGNNRLAPLTEMLGIEVKDGVLTITSTDLVNTLYIREVVDSDDFYVSVLADKIYKLVSKITSEDITMNVNQYELEIVGNGTYKIDVTLDYDGTPVHFPTNFDINELDAADDVDGEIEVTTIKKILSAIKPALCLSTDMPVYNNYYVGDGVLATDTFKINYLTDKILDKGCLISSGCMELLDIFTANTIKVKRLSDSNAIFFDGKAIVYGRVLDSVAEFQVDLLKTLATNPFPTTCKVSKVAISQVLDRISLFVGEYDDGAITMAFGKDGVTLSSKASTGVEEIKYLESVELENVFVGDVDINNLKTQIKAQTGDAVVICFGDTKSIKLVDNNIISIIALLE